MAGRKKYTLKILEHKGKKHLTKKEKEERAKTELSMSDGRIRCPRWVMSNSIAYKKWREIFPLLSNEGVLKPSDAGALARYCMAYYEYLDLIRLREEIGSVEPLSSQEEEATITELERRVDERSAAKLWEKINFIFSAQAVLSYDKAINQKMAAVLSLEDRLGLNIVARAKVIVPKKDDDADKPVDAFACI
jgi:P27 family predicted phage terminase small subunit